MKNLMTFKQLNESKSVDDILKTLLEKFEKGVDSKKLFQFLLPFKKEMDLLCRKYYKEGKIDADRIHSDLKSLSLMKEERGYYREEYDENEANNVILRYLYKFFVKWPKNFVTGVWEFFEMTVIDTWHDDDILGKVLSFFSIIMWVFVGVLIYMISTWTFLFFDVKYNGLTSGKVERKSFERAHSETYYTTISTENSTITIPQTRWVNDRWHILVKGEKGREEYWVTYNPAASESVVEGSEVKKDDNWSWEDTKQR